MWGNCELEWWVCWMRHTLPHLPRSSALPVFFLILRPTPNCLVSWKLQCYFSYIHWLQLGAGLHKLGDIPSLLGSSSSVSSEKEKTLEGWSGCHTCWVAAIMWQALCKAWYLINYSQKTLPGRYYHSQLTNGKSEAQKVYVVSQKSSS